MSALSAGAVELVAALNLPDGPSGLGTRATAETAKRDRTIADLRSEVTELKRRVGPLTDYAHDLAAELRQYREDERADLDAKVRHLASVE